MPENEGGHIGVLAERIKGVQEDVAELRQQVREDHHRLRSVEAAVSHFVDAQTVARQAEAKQYKRMTLAIAAGGLLMALGMFVLAAITLYVHNH